MGVWQVSPREQERGPQGGRRRACVRTPQCTWEKGRPDGDPLPGGGLQPILLSLLRVSGLQCFMSSCHFKSRYALLFRLPRLEVGEGKQ